MSHYMLSFRLFLLSSRLTGINLENYLEFNSQTPFLISQVFF